ncbi:hypothetical protein [Blautia faecicola]|nr:hypothetical protein [Blautia faecicola]
MMITSYLKIGNIYEKQICFNFSVVFQYTTEVTRSKAGKSEFDGIWQ